MIHNIHFLNKFVPSDQLLAHEIRVAQYEQDLIKAHRDGEHPYGEKRRDCPLCQLGK